MFDNQIKEVQKIFYYDFNVETRLLRDSDDQTQFIFVVNDKETFENEELINKLYNILSEKGLLSFAGISYMPLAFTNSSIVDRSDYFLNSHSEASGSLYDLVFEVDITEIYTLPIEEINENNFKRAA